MKAMSITGLLLSNGLDLSRCSWDRKAAPPWKSISNKADAGRALQGADGVKASEVLTLEVRMLDRNR